jgi:hypothetical protein
MYLAIYSGHISFGSPLTIITTIQSLLLVSTWMSFPDSVRNMMCDRTIKGAATTYSDAHKVLSDTIGSCNVRTVTMIHGLGIYREEQTRDLYGGELEGALILIKVVRNIDIVLNRVTRDQFSSKLHGRAAEPSDQHVYMGFCKVFPVTSKHPGRIPRHG